MSDAERRAFLSEGTRTAILGTARRDGTVHLAPIWFVLDGDDIVFNTGRTTAKGRNLRRTRVASLAIDDARPPFAYVRVEGPVTISEDLDEMLVWATRIAARYMGDDLADRYGRRNAVPGELLVRVTPTRTVTEAGVAD